MRDTETLVKQMYFAVEAKDLPSLASASSTVASRRRHLGQRPAPHQATRAEVKRDPTASRTSR